MEDIRERALCGTAPDVIGKIAGLMKDVEADEAAVITTVADKNARRQSYALLAAAAGLGAGTVAAPGRDDRLLAAE